MIVIPKDNDTNMIRREIWDELRVLDGIIRNATAVYEGEKYTYDQICARWLDQCFSNDILNLDAIIELVYAHSDDYNYFLRRGLTLSTRLIKTIRLGGLLRCTIVRSEFAFFPSLLGITN